MKKTSFFLTIAMVIGLLIFVGTPVGVSGFSTEFVLP